jgi:ribonuclease BN (tRNA processing enzyme)
VRLYALGVGDTFTEKHHTHALLVEADGFRLAIDCPDSYRRVLRAAREKAPTHAASLDLAAIDEFLVTHVHGDHMNGLEGAAYFKFFAQKRKLRLHTIDAVRETLWDGRLVASMGRLFTGDGFRDLAFEDYFDWSSVPLDREVTIGPLTVSARRTKHHVPTSALVIKHGGRTLGISSDTAFDPELVRWLAQADLVVHETNYGPAHTAYSDLLTLPAEVKDKMRLVHYPDEFHVEGSEITCLREGDVLEV